MLIHVILYFSPLNPEYSDMLGQTCLTFLLSIWESICRNIQNIGFYHMIEKRSYSIWLVFYPKDFWNKKKILRKYININLLALWLLMTLHQFIKGISIFPVVTWSLFSKLLSKDRHCWVCGWFVFGYSWEFRVWFMFWRHLCWSVCSIVIYWTMLQRDPTATCCFSPAGSWFDIKMCYGDKTVVRSSYLHNDNFFVDKMLSL